MKRVSQHLASFAVLGLASYLAAPTLAEFFTIDAALGAIVFCGFSGLLLAFCDFAFWSRGRA